MVALLSGGTGGAKLARGLLDVVGASELRVIANTGDDVEVYGAHVSPDPDLITYWLADQIDERGYGVRGDTWEVMGALEAAGRPAWFRLGDRDLAMCLIRTELLGQGERLTAAHAEVVRAMGVEASVLPMADEPVRTHVRTGTEWIALQEFMIVNRSRGPVEGVELRGIEHARPTAEVLDALKDADAIVIGPSNPVISIGPILALPGVREAIRSSPAAAVAVSPFVGGRALKGPTELFCEQAGIEPSAAGIARAYDGLIDGLVADEDAGETRVFLGNTVMDSPEARRRVAEEVLDFLGTL